MTKTSTTTSKGLVYFSLLVFSMSFLYPQLKQYFESFNMGTGFNDGMEPSFSENMDITDDEDQPCNSRAYRSISEHVFEICISDIESIRNAIQGGANSIEICVDRSQGGVTPSIGLVHQAVQLCRGSKVEVHVLIRPRAGYFTYSPDEFDIILRDIIACERVGVTGVVIGILTTSGCIDVPKMRIVRQVAKNLKLTFHRAYDICSQSIQESLDAILSIPCDRLLTSGKQPTAEMGKKQLQEILSYSNGRIEVVAACGINILNVYDLIVETGVMSVHTGSAVTSKIEDMYPFASTMEKKTSNNSVDSELSRGTNTNESKDMMDLSSDKLNLSWLDLGSSKESKAFVAPEITMKSIDPFCYWDLVESWKVAEFLEKIEVARKDSLQGKRKMSTGLHRTKETFFDMLDDSNKSINLSPKDHSRDSDQISI